MPMEEDGVLRRFQRQLRSTYGEPYDKADNLAGLHADGK